MRQLVRIATFVLAGIAVFAMPSVVIAQEAEATAAVSDQPDPDILIDLHSGIFNYLQGYLDTDEFSYYNEAISLFDSVLERDPGNRMALLFRALCHGRIGLAEREARLTAEDERSRIDETIRIRENPELRDEYEQEMADCEAKLADPDLEPSERNIIQLRRDELDPLLIFDDFKKDATVDELREERNDAQHRMVVVSKRERAKYIDMLNDLERLLAVDDQPETVIRLLEVIARSKVARLDEEEAVRILEGEMPDGLASGPPAALREASAAALSDAAAILESIQSEDMLNEDSIRAKFFLGVIRYRQAVPRQTEDEPVKRDMTLLGEAERIMTELVDEPLAAATWKSYSALYLGLIIPIRAVTEPTEAARDRALDEANSRLDQAAALDTVTPDDGQESYSDSGGAIPLVVNRQRAVLREAREQPVAKPQYINDLRLTLSTGISRDSNVVLLGERTDLPRGISDEEDYGFRLGFAVDYTLDLALIDPSLDKWTFGFRGRTSQLWHVEIDEFDEQVYGGSFALQYELAPEEGNIGPVYAQLQYDYDYTLLGREPFLSTNSISPRLRTYWDDQRGNSDLYFRFEIRDYDEPLFDKRFNRDGHYFRVGVFQSHKMFDMAPTIESWGLPAWGHQNDDAFAQEDPDYPGRYFTPFMGLEYGWDSTAGDEFDMRYFEFTFGAIVPLPYGLLFDTTIDFTWEDYLADGSLVDFHRRGREDFIQRYEVGLSRTYVLREGAAANRYNLPIDQTLMTIRGFAAWTLDDSNVVDRFGQAIFEYDRVIYGINVAFSFN